MCVWFAMNSIIPLRYARSTSYIYIYIYMYLQKLRQANLNSFVSTKFENIRLFVDGEMVWKHLHVTSHLGARPHAYPLGGKPCLGPGDQATRLSPRAIYKHHPTAPTVFSLEDASYMIVKHFSQALDFQVPMGPKNSNTK